MISMINCQVIDCGSVFGLNGDINLKIDGLTVHRCGSVFDIFSEESNINAQVKGISVTETETYIKVGEKKQPYSQTYHHPASQPSISMPYKNDDLNAIMRIALSYAKK